MRLVIHSVGTGRTLESEVAFTSYDTRYNTIILPVFRKFVHACTREYHLHINLQQWPYTHWHWVHQRIVIGSSSAWPHPLQVLPVDPHLKRCSKQCLKKQCRLTGIPVFLTLHPYLYPRQQHPPVLVLVLLKPPPHSQRHPRQQPLSLPTHQHPYSPYRLLEMSQILSTPPRSAKFASSHANPGAPLLTTSIRLVKTLLMRVTSTI